MSKLNAEQRAALQSARAKNRKLVTALGNAGILGVAVPKHVVTKIQNLEVYFAGLLDKAVVVEIATEDEVAEALSEAA